MYDIKKTRTNIKLMETSDLHMLKELVRRELKERYETKKNKEKYLRHGRA